VDICVGVYSHGDQYLDCFTHHCNTHHRSPIVNVIDGAPLLAKITGRTAVRYFGLLSGHSDPTGGGTTVFFRWSTYRLQGTTAR
jgi:hypothetical protein